MAEVPLVSIVTISFNQGAFLPRCVESVKAQGWSNVEHILVDPGSTDGTREWLTSPAASHLRTILEPDAGPADGLNKGFSATTGEIVMYLNADDELAPGAIKSVVQAHVDQPDKSILIGDGWWIDDYDRPIGYVRSDSFTRLRYVLQVAAVMQQSTSFLGADARRISFNPSNRVSWDSEYLIDSLLSGLTIGNHAAVVGYFRRYDGTITHSKEFDRARRLEYERVSRKAAPRVREPLRGVSAFAARAVKFLCSHLRRGASRQFPGLARL